MIPPNVYYYWCGQRNFEFRHYLSVMSVIRLLRPDKIIFHYEFLPVIDRNQYNTWFEDLKKDSIFFEPRPMTAPIATAFCHGKRLDKLGVIFGKLHVNGGLYTSENTWLVDLPPTARLIDLDMSVGQNGRGRIYSDESRADGRRCHSWGCQAQQLLDNTLWLMQQPAPCVHRSNRPVYHCERWQI